MDRSYWEVDPSDEKEMWLRVIGHEAEVPEETQEHFENIFSDIPAGEACLEIGAGVGRLLRPASALFSHAVGVDYSAALTQVSKRYLADWPRCEVVNNDGLTLPFPNNSFDFVYSYTCFHHMPELSIIQSNLHEIYRVLRPGALCRIQTLKGIREEGYDGYVFPDIETFWREFESVGFVKESAVLGKDKRDRDTARIWITARKP